MPFTDKTPTQFATELRDKLKDRVPNEALNLLLGILVPLVKLLHVTPPEIKRQLDAFVDGSILFAEYGAFFQAWNRFELLIEVLIMKELRLTPLETSIVCGGLMFTPKISILYSLLSLSENNNEGISLLRKTQAIASRNSLTHGFLNLVPEEGGTQLYRREVSHEYTVTAKPLGYVEMGTHAKEFIKCFEAVKSHFKIETTELMDYAKSIVAQVPIHEARAVRRRESRTNSEKAKKQSRDQKHPASPGLEAGHQGK